MYTMHHCMHRVLPALAYATLFLVPSIVLAQITPLAWYRMGEDDAFAQAGYVLSNTKDRVSGRAMALPGGPMLTPDVGDSASLKVGSNLSLQFFGPGNYGKAEVLGIGQDNNFGLEAWVKPQSVNTDQYIVYNGYVINSGWGLLIRSNGTYQALFGGKLYFGSAPAIANTWAHLAVVRDNGIATLYVNGVASGTTDVAPYAPYGAPFGAFGVAAGPMDFASDSFKGGSIDEVRAFTFPPGGFDKRQLLVNMYHVTNTSDGGPGSLRQAMSAPDAGTINVLATGTITLDFPLPIITSNLTINGPGAANLTISGANAHRVFFVDAPNATVSIRDLTVADGLAHGGNGGRGNYGGGGGLGAGGGLFVYSGNVVLSRVDFRGNSAAGGTGGLGGAAANWQNGGGGGAGLGSDGGQGRDGAGGGGGGYLGTGGNATSGYTTGGSGGGGGGGVIGAGGDGGNVAGGGGGAYSNGQPGVFPIGGVGADQLGGNGGDYDNWLVGGSYSSSHFAGRPGLTYGGGGGGGLLVLPYNYGANGGNGGAYGGGGGGNASGMGGAGGAFGGGGGSNELVAVGGENAGDGGFGGGGGGDRGAGGGGFGAGSGGHAPRYRSGRAGPFGGEGGLSAEAGNTVAGAGGGGGGALGAAIFVVGAPRAAGARDLCGCPDDLGGEPSQSANFASLTWADGSADAGSLTAGPGGPDSGGAGSTSGSSMFLFGGTTTVAVNSGHQTISGSIGGYGSPTLKKTGGGTLILSNQSTGLGVVAVQQGNLRVNSAIEADALYVHNGATLSGKGRIGATVVMQPGSRIDPGDPASGGAGGTLHANLLGWNGGASIAFHLGPDNASSDSILVQDFIKGGGGSYTFAFSGAPTCGTVYTLIHFTGSTNFVSSDFSFTYSGANKQLYPKSPITVDSAAHKLQFTAECY